MDELQIAVIGLGLLLVAIVWAYNRWQERKHRERVEQILPKASNYDVLMRGRGATRQQQDDYEGRREPGFMATEDEATADNEPAMPEESSLDVSAAEDDNAALEPDHAIDDELSPAVDKDIPQASPGQPEQAEPHPPPKISEKTMQRAMPQRPFQPLPAEWADGEVDCLLLIDFAEDVSVAKLWAEHIEWSRRIDKPLQWLGMDSKTPRWRVLMKEDRGKVGQLAVALQLADRRGPVSEMTLTDFLDGTQRLAKLFGGEVDLPSRAEVLRQANALDAFCASVDLQLDLHVVARPGSLSEMVGGKLMPIIAQAGLQLEGERFVAVDDDGNEVFALVCRADRGAAVTKIEMMSLTDIAFRLDVPRIVDGVFGFERMMGFARKCATALNGQLADAQGKPLADETINAISARISELQGKMRQQGIPAGSVRALRLYS